MLAIVVPGMARSQLCPRGLARPGLEGLASLTASQPASSYQTQPVTLAGWFPLLFQAALQDTPTLFHGFPALMGLGQWARKGLTVGSAFPCPVVLQGHGGQG